MKKRRKKKMAPNVKAYLAALKRAKSLSHVDKREHEAIKHHHRIG